MKPDITDLDAARCEFYARPWQCNMGPSGSQCVTCYQLSASRRTDFAAEEAFIELTGHPPVYPEDQRASRPAATCCGTQRTGMKPVQCANCWNVDAQRANRPAASITVPQNNARPTTHATAWARMGIITVANFTTEEAIMSVFARLGIDPQRCTVWRTPSGTLRGTGVLWDW